jgi:putative ABC transport system ATP-binding protein
MLSLQNVTKCFSLDADTLITPVNNVTLKIEQGEFIIIVGRSGTGKSTLLNLVAGLVRPTSGEISIDDISLAAMTDNQLSALRAKSIGFVFQFPSLLPSFTILENITLPTLFLNHAMGKETYGKAIETLSLMGLANKKDVFPRQLSAGEQKRVAISRSLINNPRIILADEPTSDLDNKTEMEVMSLLKDINARGVTLLMVTHSLQLLPFATRAFEMDNGSLHQISATCAV